jgi:hypothetical protein
MENAAERERVVGQVKELYHRRERALVSFSETLRVFCDLSAETAENLARFYRAEKIIKYDGYRWSVKHGAYLDADVIRRAVGIMEKAA